MDIPSDRRVSDFRAGCGHHLGDPDGGAVVSDAALAEVMAATEQLFAEAMVLAGFETVERGDIFADAD